MITYLAFYDVNAPVTLSVDAISKAMGAVLLQHGKPIAYASKSLSSTELNYPQIEKEAAAIRFGCNKFHQYIYGKELTVDTDHKPLESIFRRPLDRAPLRLKRIHTVNEMSAAERKLRGLKNRKRSITTSFAGIVNFVNEFQQERDAVEVPVRLENLVELWKEFNAVQQELEIMEDSGDDKTLQEYLKERTDFERNYYRIKGTLLLVNVLQTVSTKPSTSQQPSFPAKKPAFPRVSNYGSVQNSGFQRNCFVCSGQHNIYQCASFNNMSVDERENVVRRNQLCRNCLRRGHLAKTCSSESSCRNCNSRHHTKLCSPQRFENKPAQNIRSNKPSPPIPKPDNPASETSAAHSGVTSCSSQGSTSRKVLLATAVILMVDDTGNEYPVRALLDSGSECCFIAERVSQRMKVQRNRVDVPIAGIGQSSTSVRSKLRSTFKSRISSFKATVDLFVLPKVTVDLPTISIDASAWEIPTGIQLADPAFYESAKIDVVLGADVFFDLFNVPGRISMGDSMPHLVNSVFGWIISGKVPERKVNAPLICNVATTADLHRDMERFWLLETDDSPAYSPDEMLCEKLFVESVSRSPSGRYMVRLPMKQDVLKNLCDNRRTALHRFRLLEGRLKRSPQLAIQYREFMDDYINLGHMKQIDDSSIDHQPSFFLPHHPVVREQSSTTKLRVVFDASCKSSSGISLNDAMLVGPTIQDDLRSIILRSRIHPILIVADVAKMFRQIEIHPNDTPLQRIFWRSDPEQEVQIFELKTVTYGTAAAPFLATRVLQQMAHDESKNYPIASKATCRDIYMDDLISGTKTVNEAIELITQLEGMFSSAGMELRKYASNYQEVLEQLPESKRALQSTVDFDKDQTIKTLGLHWETNTDRLKYVILDSQTEITSTITKRTTLSCIAKLFDPLGLLGPVVVTAKFFMQALWSLKEDDKLWDWDRELPEDMQIYWKSFVAELPLLNQLRIDRFVMLPNTVDFELHFFSDASENGYGSCVYVRSTNSKGEIKTALLTSSSKVAPLKKQSIARLELCGALSSAKLYSKVSKSLRVPAKAFFWVDSTTVLSWLAATPSSWSTFVGNRVSKIQTATEKCDWNFIAGVENPADIISRGLPANKLLDSRLWWEGPHWLAQERSFWPVNAAQFELTEEAAHERKRSALTSAALAPTFVDTYIANFSNYQHMLRMTAYWRRYFTNRRLPKSERVVSQPLTTEEILGAENVLIQLVQRNSFPEEWKDLENQRPVSNKSQLRWFNPIFATDKVLRIGGRLGKSAQSYASQHQIILPKSHAFVTLLVRSYHERLLHAATQLLTNTLRLRFWILGGRTTPRLIVHSCVVCFRAKPKAIQQLMADLPSPRVKPSRPFSITGVDFWGPIYLKPRHRRDAPIKAYVCVFVCFSTKAVHLEIVTNLSTAKFLQALRRFVGRRGLCSDIFSDNGTNFTGANNEIRRLLKTKDFQHSVTRECSDNGIRWHFNPPKASHFGGLWEAAIASAQKHFVRVVGDRKLEFDDMETLLVQIECCLNSRPLTELTNDPTDSRPLTPGHFLIGEELKSVPDENCLNIPFNRLPQWQQIQKMQQEIWNRWNLEYLHTLQSRTKWFKPPVELKKDQLVVLIDENQPPMRWAMARIVDLHPGSDGVVRVVSLQTPTGKTTRSTSKICVLPIPSPSEEQNSSKFSESQ
ncbi:uncharacterized protein LOC129752613 [Uranotaenia lowii]|uniref:uncharacterized protein LOC129752613 n=1 Tax=Uranotaenia lowii TaxID=190385 RepID=UPI002479FC40|nr:uncharacterized protein LOC129752613 [Uranotaenia lowii]